MIKTIDYQQKNAILDAEDNAMDISTIKQKVLPVFKPYGVTRAGLFGSAARGEEHAESDIDMLVEITKPIGLIQFARLRQQLGDALGRPVDLVEYQTVKPRLKPYIMKDYLPLL